MPIWCKSPSTAPLNNNLGNALASHLGIQVTFLGEDFLVANMPLTTQTSEGSGLLHGGASLALTETPGRVGANACIDLSKEKCLCMEINANQSPPLMLVR